TGYGRLLALGRRRGAGNQAARRRDKAILMSGGPAPEPAAKPHDGLDRRRDEVGAGHDGRPEEGEAEKRHDAEHDRHGPPGQLDEQPDGEHDAGNRDHGVGNAFGDGLDVHERPRHFPVRVWQANSILA
ncbi:gp43, partial [Burkholderia phage BcepMu]